MPHAHSGIEESRWLLSPGPLASHVRGFSAELSSLGHARGTVIHYCAGARHFAEWLQRRGIPLDTVDERTIQAFSRHRCDCLGARERRPLQFQYVNRVRRFVDFLKKKGMVPLPARKPPCREDERIAVFLEWWRFHRGITAMTAKSYGKCLKCILPALGTDPGRYNAASIRRAMITVAAEHAPRHSQNIASVLRCYLRYLSANGLCNSSLADAVPRPVARRKLSSLPRYIPADAVNALIDSFDVSNPVGIRNRAILLLLARLALRPGDVVAMRIEDVSWTEGTLRVDGKGRREVRLPLPQDAGDALLTYLGGARPPVVNEGRIFLRSFAPYRPLKDGRCVSCIVSRAVRKLGLAGVGVRGASLLRHSAATHMLRGGATLEAVGAVLRHRSPDTTAIYAKVDVAMLRAVAQPWPGGARC